jgi:glycerol-3-phosphate dehydrogenase
LFTRTFQRIRMPGDSKSEPAPPPFNAAGRGEHWRALASEELDLLVVGGGITGVGTALDAVGRGLRVAVVDAGDWGSGTSSRSSRLIHGGLRYLETLDFGLVFEALGERRRLLDLAPHLVRPLPFLFPVYRGGEVGLLELAAGMWLYDSLSLFRGLPRHRMLGRTAVRTLEPRLRTQGLRGGAIYHDAQVDDARLTLAVARAAHDGGARTVSYARVTGFTCGADGRVSGARVKDRFTGEEIDVRARLVLSATGPWTDELRTLADRDARPRLRLTKGVHIMVRRDRIGNEGAIIFRSPVDGRVMFVLPWGDLTYVGTTDTDFAGSPSDVSVEDDDVAYLIDSANGIYPDARLTRSDVVGSWAGVRPLLAEPDEDEPGETSREHSIWREESGLLCIAGGKLTTYRTMAEEAAKRAARILRREHGVESGEFFTEHVRLPGAPEGDWDDFARSLRKRAASLGLKEEQAEHLASAYGSDAHLILDRVEADPSLAEPAVPRLPYVRAELEHVIDHEMALTPDDVLRRRLHVAYESTSYEEVERHIGSILGPPQRA